MSIFLIQKIAVKHLSIPEIVKLIKAKPAITFIKEEFSPNLNSQIINFDVAAFNKLFYIFRGYGFYKSANLPFLEQSTIVKIILSNPQKYSGLLSELTPEFKTLELVKKCFLQNWSAIKHFPENYLLKHPKLIDEAVSANYRLILHIPQRCLTSKLIEFAMEAEHSYLFEKEEKNRLRQHMKHESESDNESESESESDYTDDDEIGEQFFDILNDELLTLPITKVLLDRDFDFISKICEITTKSEILWHTLERFPSIIEDVSSEKITDEMAFFVLSDRLLLINKLPIKAISSTLIF